MTIHIHTRLKNEAWGGGNQFLKALREELRKKNSYAESAATADAVLFNGYQDLWALAAHWFRHRTQRRIYRLGPILHLHRGMKWLPVDMLVVLFASIFADAVVFQSKWSLIQANRLGFFGRSRSRIIGNAVDRSVFFPQPHPAIPGSKTKLVYASWSANWNKGFSYLAFLDEHLDFTKYAMVFIGNSPIPYRNISVEPPLPSGALADRLRSCDIFVSPVKDDACSNAILEALSCGLPVVALASGGNGELVNAGGRLFADGDELLSAIGVVRDNLPLFRQRISVQPISEIAEQYLQAIHGSIKIV